MASNSVLCSAGLVLLAAQVVSAQTPQTAYTLVQINSMFGSPRTLTIYRDGDLALVDLQHDSTHVRTLNNLSTHTSIGWDSAAAAPAGCSSGTFSGDWGDPFLSSAEFKKEVTKQNAKQTGTETVNGFATQVWEAATPDAKAKVWMDPSTGLMIKAEVTAPNQQPQVLFEIKKFTPGKPPASVFAIPAGCAAPPPPPPVDPDFVNAIMAPPEPSDVTCTVLFKVMRASTMEPLTTGFQVWLDLKGAGRQDMTASLRNGTLAIENAPASFDLSVRFPDGGETFGHIYRRCFTPRTVLLLVLKNPEKITDGADWKWVKSNKFSR